MRDLTVNLQNKPGTVAQAAEALGNAGINIEGVFGMAMGDRGELHLLVADAAVARSALQAAGADCGADRDVEVVSLVDEPGELGRHLRRIADAGVNLDMAYTATNTRLVVAAADMDALRRAMHG
ncbi:MAG TPA: hypothetical protein VH371_04470 [Candidatus Limnocylindrales bacterium]